MSVPQSSIALNVQVSGDMRTYRRNQTYVNPPVHAGGCVKVVVNAYGLQLTDGVVDVVEETVELLELEEVEEDLADDVVKTDDEDLLELELEIMGLEVVLELVLEALGQEVPVQDVATDVKI